MDIKAIQEKMRNVPFGNSAFQTKHFLDTLTPERAYRTSLINLDAKIKALKAAELGRMRTQIDIEEIQEKLTSTEGFAKRRLEVDLLEKQDQLKDQEKLEEDAKIEVAVLSSMLEKLPDISREQFEIAEGNYWKERLLLDVDAQVKSIGHADTGTLQSLRKIGIDVAGRNEKGQLVFLEIKPKQLEGKGNEDDSSPKLTSIK